MPHAPLWLMANWKMHGTRASVRDFAYAVNAQLAEAPDHLQVIFCPPAIYLDAAVGALPANARLKIGAQNTHAESKGAFTGSISAPMLRDVGAQAVIVGHSERRAGCYETDACVEAKARAAQAAGLLPVICVGETLEEYQQGRTLEVLEGQLQGLSAIVGTGSLIAYEPIWAIGSGLTPTVKEIDAVHVHIKTMLGSTQPVLYGGSVKPSNMDEILVMDSVAGALVGGASLEVSSMSLLIKSAIARVNKT